MANVRLNFYGSEKSDTQSHELTAFCNHAKELFIEIKCGDDQHEAFICLDKDTAIKLSRELRKQISYI